MKLADLISGVDLVSLLPPDKATVVVRGLEYDSRRVGPGDLFFAFTGARTDGKQYVTQALEKGAVGVVSEAAAPDGFQELWIQVRHGREALAAMSRRLLGAPDEHLAVTGVTGTNGKTTTVYAIDAMLRQAGLVTGMAGTIVYRVAGEERAAVNTTPESLDLLRLMAETLALGGTHFSAEISSHALALRRVRGLAFHTTIFTNLTRDHLDFHGTMEAYFAAKQELFLGAGGPPPKFALLNADDPASTQIRTEAATTRLTYGCKAGADLRAEKVDAGFHGLSFEIRHPNGRTPVVSRLMGHINVYNLLGAFGAGLTLGLTPEEASAGLAACEAVPGRFERVDEGQPFLLVVDYAHTDDALRNTIAVARALQPKRVLTVFGCGGDRDRTKRPLMGQVAAENSDLVVITSDNPRSEDPLDIINDVLVGVRRTDTPNLVEPDREKAIRRAIEEARPGDVLLIAGKGHETYQVLGGRTIEFDDRAVSRRILRGFGYQRKEAAG
jgi:UDP-N-acetylmuramoyl-L-alanyl-D-glutamate--2,6-diaminopimelate ligase